jgi:AAHS family 4-hydroxybenzoate transporter-like MFS transporter
LLVIQLVGLGLGSFVMGPLSDRHGRRRMLLICTAVFGILTLLLLVAKSLVAFAILRFAAGIFIAGVIPNAIVLASESAPTGAKATVAAILISGFSAGSAIAAGVSSSLGSRYGWQAIFMVGGVAPLMLLPLLYRYLPESIGFPSDRAVSPSLRHEPRSPVRTLFVDGRTVVTLLAWFAFSGNSFTLSLLGSWLPTFLEIAGGLQTKRAVMLTGLFAASGLIGSPLLGLLIDRTKAPAALSAAAFLVGSCAFLLVGQVDTASPLLLPATILLAGVCNTGASGALNALLVFVYPAEARSTGVAWAWGAGKLGSISGPLAGGLMLATHLSFASILAAAASVAFFCFVATGIIWFRQRHAAAGPAGA